MPRMAALLTSLLLLCLGAAVEAGSAEAVAPAKLPLAESERVYIATIEHRGAMLNLKAFRAITAAVRASDTAQLKKFFAPNFAGEWLEVPQNVSWQTEPITLRRITSASGKPEAVTGEEFIKRLISWRHQFQAEPKVELALMSLSPVQREQTNGAW